MQNWLDLTQLFRLLRGCVRTAKCNPTQGDDARPSPRHSHQFSEFFVSSWMPKLPTLGRVKLLAASLSRKVSRASCARPTARSAIRRIVVMLRAVR